MARERLRPAEIESRLGSLPAWRLAGDAIRRECVLPDFRAAIDFVGRVADLAEAADHHPDIDVRYDRVTLTLSTHSSGGLTALDFDLATRIDGVLRP